MGKIQPELEAQIASDPNTKIDVLITLKGGSDPASLNLPEYRVLMDNILASQLDAKKISGLSKAKEVVAIEMDGKMGTL